MQTQIPKHPSADRLIAFDLGQLPRQEWTEIERHVAVCDSCCQQLEQLPDDDLIRLIKSSVPRGAGAGKPREEPCVEALAGVDVPPELRDHPRYRILDVLGSGGMGVVFKAEHRLMERIVALKVMNARLMAQRSAVERFRQEVKAAARLSHPNIVTAYDADQADGLHFLVMELVEGVSLDRLLRVRGPLPVGHACDMVRQAALGLQHAFERGMTHRDIKPGNLLLTPDGQVKVLDFGLARFVSEEGPNDPLTPSGYLIGTPDYLAPEQALDPRAADVRADVYSLGCTLYHLLTGAAPFADGSVMEKLLAHRERPPLPVDALRQDLPAPASAILERMMAKEPSQRFATPAEVAAALAPFAEGADAAVLAVVGAVMESRASQLPTLNEPRPARKKRIAPKGVVAAAIIVLLGGLAAWLAWPESRSTSRVAQPEPDSKPHIVSTPASIPIGTPPATVPETRSVRDQAVAWLKAKNSFGESSPELTQLVAQLDKSRNKGQSFYYRLGPNVVRSNRPTILVGRCGAFHVFEMDEEQLRHWAISNPNETEAAGFLDEALVRPKPLVRLSGLKVDNAAKIDGDKPLTGSVDYEYLEPIDVRLVMRQTRIGPKGEFSLVTRLPLRDARTGKVKLDPEPVNQKGDWSGLVLVFVELCVLREENNPNLLTVVSNSVGTVITVERAVSGCCCPSEQHVLLDF